jgi:hypothetical protein
MMPEFPASPQNIRLLQVLDRHYKMRDPNRRQCESAFSPTTVDGGNRLGRRKIGQIQLGHIRLWPATGGHDSRPGNQPHPVTRSHFEVGRQAGAAQGGVATHCGPAAITVEEVHSDTSWLFRGQDHEAVGSYPGLPVAGGHDPRPRPLAGRIYPTIEHDKVVARPGHLIENGASHAHEPLVRVG